jgi:type IV pilus assembly protein PilZ
MNIQGGILQVNIQDKQGLYLSYMPFLKNGGIFVPTKKEHKIGDKVFLMMTLLNDPEKVAVSGVVAWVTPQGANSMGDQGIGVHFDNNGHAAKGKIENLLAGMLSSDKPTYTM